MTTPSSAAAAASNNTLAASTNTTTAAPPIPPRAPAAPVPAQSNTDTTVTPEAVATRATLLRNSIRRSNAHSNRPSASGARGSQGATKEELEKKIHDINNRQEYDKLLEDAGNKLVMIEFYAQWCGACKLIGIKLKTLAQIHYEKAIIARVDVEEFEELAVENQVASIPTFVFIKHKNKLDTIVGSNAEKMEKALDKYMNLVGREVPIEMPIIKPVSAQNVSKQ